eukprot:4519107-Alexandrium_andersonii.AAC.1
MGKRALERGPPSPGPDVSSPSMPLLRRLVHFGAPQVLLQLVWAMATAEGLVHAHGLDFLEFFAGRREVTQAQARVNNFVAISYEVKDNPILCDFCGLAGFAHAFKLATMLDGKVGSGCMLAPVCSTWVSINLGTSGRSASMPLGNAFYPSVARANKMISRVVLVLMLLTAQGI